MEYRVVAVLIDKANPMNPRDVAQELGLTNIKPIADTLCYLGLISRWIRDEETSLFADSRLFNDRYIETSRRPG